MRTPKCEDHGTPLVCHPDDRELTSGPADCPLCDAMQLWLEHGEPDVGDHVGNSLRMLSNIGRGIIAWRGGGE